MIDYTPIEKRTAVEPTYTPAAQRTGPFEKFQLPQTAPVYTPLTQRIGDFAGGVGEKINSLFASKVSADNTAAVVQAPAVTKVRGVDFTPDTVDQAKRSLFSEFSNRTSSPVQITGMLNVAVNKALSSGKPLDSVLTDPNFIQGVSNKRYSTTSNLQGKEKDVYDFVSKTVDEALRTGLNDHTKGATHFVYVTGGPHKNDLVTMSEKEFATYLAHQGSSARDAYAASLLGK